MDWLQILEQYGVPLVVAVAMFMMVKQQNKLSCRKVHIPEHT